MSVPLNSALHFSLPLFSFYTNDLWVKISLFHSWNIELPKHCYSITKHSSLHLYLALTWSPAQNPWNFIAGWTFLTSTGKFCKGWGWTSMCNIHTFTVYSYIPWLHVMCSSLAANNFPLSWGDSKRYPHMKIKPKIRRRKKLQDHIHPCLCYFNAICPSQRNHFRR